jgi:flagellar motor component MotA
MANKMISHMAKELMTEQILTESFEIFENMGIKFDEEQLELLKEYLDALLENNIVELEEDSNLIIADKQLYNYVCKLMDLLFSVTFFCFTNWGIALFYKDNRFNNDDGG